MVDGYSAGLTTTEKHEMLKAVHRLRITFANSTIENAKTIFMKDLIQWEVCADVVIFRTPRYLKAFQLDSPARSLPGKEWTVELPMDPAAATEELCVDPYQDLLVLFECDEDITW